MLNAPLMELYNLIGIFNTSLLNPNPITMMMSLMILLMRVIGYCKQEENTCNLLYIIPSLQQSQETLPIKKCVSFRKGITREETAYPTLKDERYFDSFSRSLYITAQSHECEDVLVHEYTPSNSEKELFEPKQDFMFSVLDKHLLTDMGKTIVRKYVHTTDAQSVWKDFQEDMKSSSKGVCEKRRLTQSVTNTVLDNNYKGTTEQFALYFNEQFRQLEEI